MKQRSSQRKTRSRTWNPAGSKMDWPPLTFCKSTVVGEAPEVVEVACNKQSEKSPSLQHLPHCSWPSFGTEQQQVERDCRKERGRGYRGGGGGRVDVETGQGRERQLDDSAGGATAAAAAGTRLVLPGQRQQVLQCDHLQTQPQTATKDNIKHVLYTSFPQS